jgi:hypothetical protein
MDLDAARRCAPVAGRTASIAAISMRIGFTHPTGGDLTAFCDSMESEEGWLNRKFRIWRTHPWMFVAGFAAGLAVFEAARLIFG